MSYSDRRSTLLNADVVGYSAMMARDELATARSLVETMGRLAAAVVQHGGRVLDAPGDNLLAEFGNESAAFACALHVQRKARQRERGDPGEPRLRLRIGLHSGTLIEGGSVRYGHAINVSARLQCAAPADGILVSALTATGMNPSDVRCALAAPRLLPLKNIPSPVWAFEACLT